MHDELIMGPEAVLDRPDIPGIQIWGWMSNLELLWLNGQAARMRGGIVEIGCLHGRSAYALAVACPGPVICIDPWDDVNDHSMPSFMGNVGYLPNVYPLRGRSPEILTAAGESEAPWKSLSLALAIGEYGWPQVDMVFIDGAHAYEAVLADISAWLPLTRKLICGHDYCNADAGYPGVAQAVNQVFGDRVFVPDGTSIWAVDLEADRHVEPGVPTGEITWTDEYDKTSTYELRWPA